jgi:hypothetical protein
MPNQALNQQNERIGLVVISTLFLALAFYFTFVLGNIAQGVIFFGIAFAFFVIVSNPKV